MPVCVHHQPTSSSKFKPELIAFFPFATAQLVGLPFFSWSFFLLSDNIESFFHSLKIFGGLGVSSSSLFFRLFLLPSTSCYKKEREDKRPIGKITTTFQSEKMDDGRFVSFCLCHKLWQVSYGGAIIRPLSSSSSSWGINYRKSEKDVEERDEKERRNPPIFEYISMKHLLKF